jgi:membrane protease YdiL (CAAX protease family)
MGCLDIEATRKTIKHLPRSADETLHYGVPHWSLWAPFIAAFLVWGIPALLGWGTLFVASEMGWDAVTKKGSYENAVVGMILSFGGVAIGLIACGFLWRKFAHPVSLWRAGVRRPASLRSTILRLAVAAAGIFLLWEGLHKLLFSISISFSLGGPPELKFVTALQLAWTIFLCPIVEEVIFRGLLFTALSRFLGLWGAAIVSALLFGCCHSDSVFHFFWATGLGIVCATLYWRTGSLLSAILVHSLVNARAMGAGSDGWWMLWLLMSVIICGLWWIVIKRNRRNGITSDMVRFPKSGFRRTRPVKAYFVEAPQA